MMNSKQKYDLISRIGVVALCIITFVYVVLYWPHVEDETSILWLVAAFGRWVVGCLTIAGIIWYICDIDEQVKDILGSSK